MGAEAIETGERRQTLDDLMAGAEGIRAMLAAAEEDGDEATAAALEAALGLAEGQVEDKVARTHAVLKRLEIEETAHKLWAKSQSDLAKQSGNAIKRLREWLHRCLTQHGRDKVQTMVGTVSLGKPRIDLGEVDDQAAFEAGLGECRLTFAVADVDDMRLLAEVAVEARSRGDKVCIALTVLTDLPSERDGWRRVAEECSSEPQYGYAADKDTLTSMAARDLVARDEWEKALRTAEEGEPVPEEPAPTIPPAVARPQWVRVLQVRG